MKKEKDNLMTEEKKKIQAALELRVQKVRAWNRAIKRAAQVSVSKGVSK